MPLSYEEEIEIRREAVLELSSKGLTQQQDRQMESMGRTILEDKLELRRSSNVKSSDELRAEKSGTVGLSGVGKYNPASGRRTRLSF
jgi:hypothetical protein